MRGKIKIAIAHSQAHVIGGAEIAVSDLCRELTADFEISMLVPGPGNLSQMYTHAGYSTSTFRVSQPRRKYPGVHTLTSLILAHRLKKMGIALVLCNTLAAVSRYRDAAHWAGAKVGVYLRDHCADSAVNRKYIALCDFRMAVSEAIRRHCIRCVPNAEFPVAYDWIDRREVLRQAADGPAIMGGVGIVGRIQDIKQQDLFLRAAAIVKEYIRGVRFFIIGEASEKSRVDQEYKKYLMALAAELGLGDTVEFLGFRKDVIRLIMGLDILCVPSKNEAFPRVILESNLLGIPVVAGRVGGCPEMITDRVSGRLFDSNAEDAKDVLATIIQELLLDPEQRRRLAAVARDNTVKKFCSNAPVQRVHQILVAALSR